MVSNAVSSSGIDDLDDSGMPELETPAAAVAAVGSLPP